MRRRQGSSAAPLVRMVAWTRRARGPSRRMLEACAIFGLGVRATSGRGRPPRWIARAARRITRELRHGQIALITGPSGCGKSTLLGEIRRSIHARGGRCLDLGLPRSRARERGAGSIIDEIRSPLRTALAVLSRAGLGDALLFARRLGELSEGERWRFALARAMLACERRSRRGRTAQGPITLCIDEFLTPLDRVTARAVALTLARWARSDRRSVRVVCATAHADVEHWLHPDIVIRPTRTRVHVEQRGGNGGKSPKKCGVHAARATRANRAGDVRRLPGARAPALPRGRARNARARAARARRI